MKDKKKINRNPFNEKLIHRYYFESLYLENLTYKQKLVPSNLKSKISKLNLIIPEDTVLFSGYRSDFTIYFKGDNDGIPVEIKWSSKEFKKSNQINALKNKNGFLVSFDEPINNEIPHVKLDINEFRKWLIKRIDTLWDDSVSEKIKTKVGIGNWVVVLRGEGSLKNFHKMIDHCNQKRIPNFWAFKNGKKVMQNLLDLSIEDEIIFIFAKTRGNERSGMIPNSKEPLEIIEIFYTTIKEPYYMNRKSTFFEKQRNDKRFKNTLKNRYSDLTTLPINERFWPHFFDFKITDSFQFENKVLKRNEMSKDLRNKLADSSNYGGILMSLSSVDSKWLKGNIRLLKR